MLFYCFSSEDPTKDMPDPPAEPHVSVMSVDNLFFISFHKYWLGIVKLKINLNYRERFVLFL